MLTNSSKGNLLGSKEEEIVALLHASDNSTSIEILDDGVCQPIVISLGNLHSASIFLAYVFKTLHVESKLMGN